MVPEQCKPSGTSEHLSKKVVRGGGWVFAMRLATRGLNFIRTLILARMLAPDDFGLLGIALLSILILENFTETGFQAALVQKKDDIKDSLDTAWTISIIRGVFLFVMLIGFAPLIADFFNSPDAAQVIKVIAISTLFVGGRNIGMVFWQKQLEFNKQFVFAISTALIEFTVTVILAYVLRDVWSLVYGLLAANFSRLVLSYIIHPYRPKLCFKKNEFKALFGYGKWIFGASMLNFLIIQGDNIFVGKIVGTSALGLYQMAFLYSNLPATEISNVISQVTFPAYAKLQGDKLQLGELFLKVLQLTAFVAAPIAAGIFILAQDFVLIFLGAKWIEMVPAMHLLAFAGLFRAIASITVPIFNGVGQPRINTGWQIFRFLVLAALIYPLTKKMGILGASAAVLISIVLACLGYSIHVVKITGCALGQYLKMVLIPLVNASVMGFVMYGYKLQIGSETLMHFCLLIVTGSVVYFLGTLLADKVCKYRIVSLVKEIRAL